jgi:hypothetical protein
MIKTPLFSKCATTNFEKLFSKLGYAYFTKGVYNLNIIGVRRDGLSVTNKFDDYLVVLYNTDTVTKRQIYTITTDPGKYYMNNPISKKGTAILVPGQYRGGWKIGKHKNQYQALVQTRPVKVFRDTNLDSIYDLKPQTKENGVFGINIHKSNPYVESTLVDKWSAGCQVFSDPKEFASFMKLCKKQKEIFGDSFTYTLINESDLYLV